MLLSDIYSIVNRLETLAWLPLEDGMEGAYMTYWHEVLRTETPYIRLYEVEYEIK